MRVTVTVLALMALTGCKTTGDVRGRNLVERSITSRGVSEVAGCIALAATGRQIEIGSDPLPNGTAITISMRVAGIKTVMSVYDIEDFETNRRVTLYSVGGNTTSPKPISGKAAACL